MHLTSQLKRALERNFPKIDIAFAYGSAVFHQRNHDSNGSMIDFIFAVQEPLSWHEENRMRNPHHYSFLKYLGAETITNVQCRYGAGVYYNTLVDLQLRSSERDVITDNIAIKYGVVSCSDLCQDLEHWTRLYISGRLHKPVLMINCEYDLFDRAQARNLTNALLYALICLPYKFSERELFLKIAGISYSGDFRMTFGENPKKVQNIVDGNYPEMVSLYKNIIKNCQFIQRSVYESDVFYSSKQEDTLQLVKSLPHNVHVHMRHRITSKYDISYGKQKIRKCVQRAVRDIVRSSSRSQSIKGIFTAGAWKSALYVMKKLDRTYWKSV